jgi:hypothetical protein
VPWMYEPQVFWQTPVSYIISATFPCACVYRWIIFFVLLATIRCRWSLCKYNE